jgi:hypothetical protein
VDRHWGFAKARNAEGAAKTNKVTLALKQLDLQAIYFSPKLSHPFEFREEKLPEGLDESSWFFKQSTC